VNQHQLPTNVDKVESIHHPAKRHIELGSHLKAWWSARFFQHHESTPVNAIEATLKHHGCSSNATVIILEQRPVVIAGLGHPKHIQVVEAEQHC